MSAAPTRCPWLFDAPFAHRGLWLKNGAPENSMAAFRAASDADLGVELDVRVSSDHEAMIFHDDKLERMTGAPGLMIEKSAADLAKIKLRDTGETIPSLSDLLSAFPNMALLVEMKVTPGAEGPLEARTAALLKDRKGPTAVMSFNPATLALFATHAPHIARGQLTTGFKMTPGAQPTLLALDNDSGAAISKPDFLSCNIDALAEYGAPVAKRLGLPLITWTVRTPAQLEIARNHASNWIFEALPVAEVALAR